MNLNDKLCASISIRYEGQLIFLKKVTVEPDFGLEFKNLDSKITRRLFIWAKQNMFNIVIEDDYVKNVWLKDNSEFLPIVYDTSHWWTESPMDYSPNLMEVKTDFSEFK